MSHCEAIKRALLCCPGSGAPCILIGGDIITAIDGEPVPSVEALRAALQEASPGDTVTLSILRDGEEQELDVTLEEVPTAPR